MASREGGFHDTHASLHVPRTRIATDGRGPACARSHNVVRRLGEARRAWVHPMTDVSITLARRRALDRSTRLARGRARHDEQHARVPHHEVPWFGQRVAPTSHSGGSISRSVAVPVGKRPISSCSRFPTASGPVPSRPYRAAERMGSGTVRSHTDSRHHALPVRGYLAKPGGDALRATIDCSTFQKSEGGRVRGLSATSSVVDARHYLPAEIATRLMSRQLPHTRPARS
jgi:hypothetical protein